MAKPVFIVFEGGEGTGKSTQAKALHRRLRRLGVSVKLVHEPGGTPIGDRLRRWLKFGRGITIQTELLFFEAARSQLVKQVIRPALARGQIVICDRFAGSTVAYQAYGRGVDLGLVNSLNEFAVDGVKPDLTVLLDLGVEQALGRKKSRGDCFEREEYSFHLRVRDGYLKQAAANPDKWLVVDAGLPVEQVEQVVWARVQPLLI